MKILIIISGMVIILLIAFTIYNLEQSDRMDNAIKEHKRVSDSLQAEFDNIITNVQRKDILLLEYLLSLDKTMDALKKDAIKNSVAFSENSAIQDSIRLKYCEEMSKLGSDFAPSNCK